MINEQELSVFVNSSLDFFKKNTGIDADTGEPSIELGDPPFKHITGLIDISGVVSGFVAATSDKDDLIALLKAMGEEEIDGFMLQDVIGELASTISSNARQEFGEKFYVSVPKIVVNGAKRFFHTDNTLLVLPITWKNCQIDIVIGIKLNS